MAILVESAKLILAVVAAGFFVGLLATIIHIGRDRWREARVLSGSPRRVLSGEVKTDRDGLRDPRISKGKVWDEATKHWQGQGKLSDEYVKNLVS